MADDLAGGHVSRVAVVVMARGAIAAAPRSEMEDLARQIAGLPGVTFATYAFTEQGLPPLREVVADLRKGPYDCPPSALLRQIEGLHERRMTGSS